MSIKKGEWRLCASMAFRMACRMGPSGRSSACVSQGEPLRGLSAYAAFGSVAAMHASTIQESIHVREIESRLFIAFSFVLFR
jgi:hypothetical protein